MDTSQTCILCSHQNHCPEGALFLYAATPILRQIVATHLTELGVAFERHSHLFRLPRGHGAELGESIQNLRNRLSDAERADIRVSSERGPALLAAPTLDLFGKSLETAWFDEAIQADRFTTFFQPIVVSEAGSERVFAHECLIRLFADRDYSGGEIIDAAITRGSVHLFDSYARRLSIRKAGAQFCPGTKLFINFMPSSIYDPAFCMASTLEEMGKTDLRPADVVFEVVESDHVRDIKHLGRICDYYRRGGFGFALDDVGSGSNSLQAVCDLKPDFIKLDKSLISKIDEPMYLTAVQKLVEFAHQYDVKVRAEGVETEATKNALIGVGISYFQGYYFGRPLERMTSANAGLVNLSQQLSEKVPCRVPGVAAP